MRIPALFLAVLLTVPAVFAQLKPQPNDLFVPETSANRMVIPIAGEVQGNNNTHFRSDISIINFRDVTQNIELRWLPEGESGEDLEPFRIELPARSGFFSENFVATVMKRSGLGGIEIVGVNADGSIDENARIHVTSRIWTPEPNVPNGTMSQTFPAVIHTSAAGPLRWIFGVRRSDQYRLNAGITNLSSSAQRFRVTAVGSTGGAETPVEFEMPSRSIRQITLAGAGTGSFQVVVQNISPTPSSSFEAWASSIDNVTGDAWSQIAFPAPQ
ncbi:MAG TPA: hypothetical protein VF824_10875 [Thermoanaerobaculia bacterium]